MTKKPLILVGGGGHCKSCIDVIEATGAWEIKGILDQGFTEGQLVLGYPMIGTDEEIDKLVALDNYFLVTVGQVKSAAIRKRIFSILKLKNAKIATVISPKATVSRFAQIGTGTIIHHNCVVNAGAQVGENNIINTSSIIEHDTQVGHNNHISTCAVLNGNVNLGDNCFIGSGTIIINGISIANNIVIGAGSLVIKNIEEPGAYVGVPVKRMGL